MGPAEIASRLREFGNHLVLSVSHQTVARQVEDLPVQTQPIEGVNGHLKCVNWDTQDRIVCMAAPWLNGHTTLFGLEDLRFGKAIDWHRDYSTGTQAPVRYSGWINHRDPAVAGNVKYIWELNRLQHLVPLMLASLWTERQAYRQEVEKQIESWCDDNPFMQGVNWKSPLEAAIRLISWSVLAFLTEGTVINASGFSQKLQRNILLHQYFIRHFHSTNSSANNHLIGEMSGLYTASTLWPGPRHGREWREYARTRLIEELDRQVHADGVTAEQAIDYQLFVFEFFLLAAALGTSSGDSFPETYWKRLSSMLGFLGAITDRAGHFPLFGDGDDGQVINLGDARERRARSLLSLRAAATTNNCDNMTGDLRTTLLLWGQSLLSVPLQVSPPADQALISFPMGGYHVLSSDRGGDNEIMVIFDVAPFGLAPLYAHAHADALSFWLSYGGHEFLVDPGTYCYDNSPWRSYFRSTAAHNTIRVDGQDQAVQAGVFLWRHPVTCKLEMAGETDGCVEVEGCHDGYARLPDPVVHHRRMRLFRKSRTLAIIDRLECRENHQVEMFFHFGDGCRVYQLRPNLYIATCGDKSLALQFDSRLQIQLHSGSEEPISGWISRSFGVKVPSCTLVGTASITGSVPFFTEITPA